MKILIISCFFPPQNVIASQRPYSWAKYWSRLGHDVTVLTPTKDLSKADLTPMPFDGFRVIEVAPGGLFQFLRSVMRGSGARAPATPAGEGVGGARAGWIRCLLAGLKARGLFSSARMPDPFDLWFAPALRAMPDSNSGEFDLVVSTFGPYVTHLLGWRAKCRWPRAVWICDFRDLWTRNHVYPGIWPFTLLERCLERFFLRRCDLATTVSEPLAAILRADHPSLRVETIPNGVDLEDLGGLDPASVFLADGRRRVVYTGSLHPQHRDPRPLLEALAELSFEERAKIELVFVGPNLGELRGAVEKLGLGENVRIGESVSRDLALRMQRDADVLLFLEQAHESSRDGVLTGKVFEYMASQRPIWAVGVSESSTIGRMLSEYKAGRAFGKDRAALALALRELCATGRPPSTEGLGVANFDRGALARRMLELVGP